MNNKTNNILIFGFGSLINRDSLLVTASRARSMQPATITGFRREFSMWDPVGFSETNPDVAGIAHCALDVIPDAGSDSVVNGVAFSVDADDFAALKQREVEYMAIVTQVYDFETNQLLGDCYVFSSGKRDGNFAHNNIAQQRYLEVCLDGARQFGQEFFDEFLRTTYIGEQNIHVALNVPFASVAPLPHPNIAIA